MKSKKWSQNFEEAFLLSYIHFVIFFVLQGRGFEGFEGGGGYPRLSEWSQMEAMVILPISYLHDIAVKCLVFLSYTPSNSSALCALSIWGYDTNSPWSMDPQGCKDHLRHLECFYICLSLDSTNINKIRRKI